MEFKIIFLLYLLGIIDAFTFGIKSNEKEYCFGKEINSNDQTLSFNYATIGEKKELVDVILKQISPQKKEIYSIVGRESGHHKTNPLTQGRYNLCFYPKTSTNDFQISFNCQTSEEEGDIMSIATDTQFKEVRQKIEEIKNGMRILEQNNKIIYNRKFSHFMYLSNYISQIKGLTFIKIIIVGIISLFQIFVIRRMFGDDKRMSQIKTNKNINSKSEFL